VNGLTRGLLSTGLLLGAILLVLASGGAAAGDIPRLAAVGGGAVALRALLLVPGVGRAFGVFALPVDLGASLTLVLFALTLTGGVTSELYPLLLLEVVLGRLADGPPAGRFLTVAATAGAAALAVPAVVGSVSLPIGPLLRVAWPLAVLLVLEAGGLLLVASPAVESRDSTAARTGNGAVTPQAPSARDGRQDLLHDLKSPLSVVRVYADLIAEGARRGEPPRPEHLTNIGNEIGLMEALVGVIRPAPAAPAAPPSRPRPRTDLLKLLDSLAESYRTAHGENLLIEYVSDEEGIVVAADPVAIQRALRNVLDNAVKYTPAGGQVRIRASVAAQHAFVVIGDTGIGMTREEQKRAFDYAYRGEAARASGAEGRGLGLALVRELLEEQGGKISLLSEPGRGLEVTIMLPLHRPEAA